MEEERLEQGGAERDVEKKVEVWEKKPSRFNRMKRGIEKREG